MDFEEVMEITEEEWRMVEQDSRAYNDYVVTCNKEYLNSLERMLKSGRTIGAERIA